MNGDMFGGGTGADARRAPGRPVARPRPERRLRVAAHDPRRGQRHRARRRGRPAARRRPRQGHDHEPARTRTLESPGARARLVGADARRTSRPGQSVDVDLTLDAQPVQRASRSRSASSGHVRLGRQPDRRGAAAEARPARRSSTSCRSTRSPAISGACPATAPTLLAWGNDPVVPAEIEGQQVRRVANVLYEVPLPFTIGGTTTFSRRPAAQQRRRGRARTSSPRTRGPSASGIGRRRGSPTGRSRSRARSTPTQVVVGDELRRRHRVAARRAPACGSREQDALRPRRPTAASSPQDGLPGHRGPRRADRRVGPVRAHAPAARRTSSTDAGALGRPGDRRGPGPVRQRAARTASASSSRSQHRGDVK